MSFSLPSDPIAGGAGGDGVGAVRTAASTPTIVNKRELARFLRISMPTLDAKLASMADFPIVRRGGGGVEWAFDAEAVQTYMAAHRAAEETAEAERAERQRQLAMPIDKLADPAALGMTPQARLAEVKARQGEQELARTAGLLVPVTDYTGKVGPWLSRLSRWPFEALRAWATEQGWTEAQLSAADQFFRNRQDALRLESSEDLLAPADAVPDGGLFG